MPNQSFDGRLGPIIDECLERIRTGENPAVEDYARQYPELAEQIREVLPPLLLMEGSAGGVEPSIQSEALPKVDDFGDYRIVRELGRGGMGVVYEAHQESLDRRVALKMLRFQGLQDAHYVDRFLIEARAAGALQHPNIVPVFDVGQHEDNYYYAMQLIEGEGLDQILRQLKHWESKDRKLATRPTDQVAASTLLLKDFREDAPVPAEFQETASTVRIEGSVTGRPSQHYCRNVARIGATVADALHHSHSNGILHRDIKPSNLLLDSKENVWITDFGLAKFEKEDLTMTGDIVGTLRYMAPERFEGWSDPRSDIYSLGATLYEMLTLRPIFDAKDRNRLIKQVLHEDPIPIRKIDPKIPAALEIIVHKTLAKEPAERYRTADELKQDLMRFVEDRPIFAKRPNWSQRISLWYRRNPVVASLSIAFAIFAMVAIGVLSFATLRLNDSLNRTRVAEENERKSRVQATQNLIESYMDQSRALQASENQGRHFESLKVIREAVKLAKENGAESDTFATLQQLAISSFGQIDIESIPEKVIESEDAICATFGHQAKSYAVLRDNGVTEVEWLADPLGGIQFEGDWDLNSGAESFGLLFSPDDSYLAIRGKTRKGPIRLRIYRLSDQKLLAEVPTSGTRDQGAVKFSHLGNHFTYRSKDGKQVLLAETLGGKVIQEVDLPDPNCGISRVSLCPRGCHLVLIENSRIHMYQFEPGKPTGINETIETGSQILDVSWSRNGRFIATGNEDANVYIWEISNGKKPWAVCHGHMSEVQHVSFSRNGRLLLSKGKDLTTRIWDPHLGKQLVIGKAGTQISSDDRFVLDLSDPKKLKRFRLSPIQDSRVFFGGSSISNIINLRFSLGATTLTSASRSRDIHVWDPQTGQTLFLARTQPAERKAKFRWSQQSSTRGFIAESKLKPSVEKADLNVVGIVQASGGNVIHLDEAFFRHPSLCQPGSLLNLVGGEHKLTEFEIPQWMDFDIENGTISYSDDLIAVSRFESKVTEIWSRVEQQKIAEIDNGEKGALPSISPNGKFLAISTRGKFRILRTSDWETIKEFSHELSEGLGYAAFTHDGHTVALCQMSHLELYSTNNFEPVGRLPVSRGSQLSAGYSAGAAYARFDESGRYLAVGTLQNTVQLWDLKRLRRQLKELGLRADF